MLSSSSGSLLALLSTSIGIAGAIFGVSNLIGSAKKIVPFSGGLLIGIAVFGVFPELTEQYGLLPGFLALAAGIALLWGFDKFVYPICPSCSHTHDHAHCATTLHGFALPLIMAASAHAFLDGLGIAAAQAGSSSRGLAIAVVAGVTLHKIPEGIALGIMLHAAMKSKPWALAWCVVIEGATYFGALLEQSVTAHFGNAWVTYALTLAGGSFLYLGFHAVHGEWRRRGTPAFVPALTGAAGAAVIQQGLHLFLR